MGGATNLRVKRAVLRCVVHSPKYPYCSDRSKSRVCAPGQGSATDESNPVACPVLFKAVTVRLGEELSPSLRFGDLRQVRLNALRELTPPPSAPPPNTTMKNKDADSVINASDLGEAGRGWLMPSVLDRAFKGERSDKTWSFNRR